MIRPRHLSEETKRNLRHWAMELVVVVVGVLLALWAQEWAEERRQAADDEQIMREVRQEIRDYVRATATYQIQEACRKERLAVLRDQLSRPSTQWEGAALPLYDDDRNLLFPNVVRGWADETSRDQFDRALDAGTIERLPEASDLRRAYRVFDWFERSQTSLSQDLGEIRVLAGPRTLSASDRFEMLQRLARIDNYMNYLRWAAKAARDYLPADYLAFTDEEIAKHRDFVKFARKGLGDCVVDIDLRTGKPKP